MKRNKMKPKLETNSTDIQLSLAVNMYWNRYLFCVHCGHRFFFKSGCTSFPKISEPSQNSKC